MTQTQIEYFEKVYSTQNMAKAAEELLVTRSVISRLISGLEEELGVQLFERTKNGVIPTRYGEEIHVALKNLQSDYMLLMTRIKNITETADKPITIGVTPTNISTMYNLIYRGFKTEYPDIEIKMIESDVRTLCAKLRDDEISAFVGPYKRMAVGYPHFCSEPVFDVRMSLGVANDSPLAGRENVDLTDLCKIPLGMLSSFFPGERMLTDACMALTHRGPNIVIKTSNIELLRRLIREGEINALLPDNIMFGWDDVTPVPLAFLPTASHFLCWNSEYLVPRNLQTFLDYILGKFKDNRPEQH